MNFKLVVFKFARQILVISAVAVNFSIFNITFPIKSIQAESKAQTNPKTLSDPKVEADPQSIPEQLKLDPKQKEKINAIRADARKDIKMTLTPAQQTKYAEGIKKNQKVSVVLNSLNLSPEQKTKLKSIVQTANAKIKAVLTPEQLKMLQKNKQG
jgi:Spy/CpxP family protein refolding chaperone